MLGQGVRLPSREEPLAQGEQASHSSNESLLGQTQHTGCTGGALQAAAKTWLIGPSDGPGRVYANGIQRVLDSDVFKLESREIRCIQVSVKSEAVQFRLKETFFNQLQGHADDAKVSVNDEARRRVMESLRDDGRFAEMRDRFESLEGELRDLKGKFAVAVQALLIATTYQGKKPMTPEDARKWVDENLRGS